MVEISLQVFVEEDHPKSCKNFAMLMLPCGLTIELLKMLLFRKNKKGWF